MTDDLKKCMAAFVLATYVQNKPLFESIIKRRLSLNEKEKVEKEKVENEEK